MARLIQNNFSGGCISPSLFGRSDLQAYYKGCAKAENFIVTKEGSIRKRHGITSFYETIGDYGSECRVIPYIFDRANGGFVYLHRSNANLVCDYWRFGYDSCSSSTTISNFQGTLSDLQHKQIGDEIWLTNGDSFYILTITDNFTITNSSWSQVGKPSSPNSISATAHGFDGYGSKGIRYAVWVVKDGIKSQLKTTSVNVTEDWVSGAYITISFVVPSNDVDCVIVGKGIGSTYGELSKYFKEDLIQSGNGWGPRNVVTDDNISPGDSTYEQTNVLGEHFKDPLCIDCFQQRMVFANAKSGSTNTSIASTRITTPANTYTTIPRDPAWVNIVKVTRVGTDVTGQCTITNESIVWNQKKSMSSSVTWYITYTNGVAMDSLPMTMWFSEVGNIDNFYANRPSSDSDAFSPTICSTGPSFIRWIVSYQEMMVLFTDSGLFSVGFSQTQGFSASTCRISRFSNISVSPSVQPIVTDAGIVFVAADNKSVYTAAFDLNENMIKPINRSVLVEHLTRNASIKSIALQSSPNQVIWVVTEDGRYSTFTFEKNEEVFAWSDGFVEGAKIIDIISTGSVTDPTTESPWDRTYGDLVFVVEKSGHQYLCRLNLGYSDNIAGAVSNVKSTLTTLRSESQERTIAGYKKNVKDLIIRLFETGGISVKPTDGGSAIPLVSAKTGTNDLFTGDVKVMPRGCIDETGQMTFVSDNDKPCEVLQIVTTMEVEG